MLVPCKFKSTITITQASLAKAQAFFATWLGFFQTQHKLSLAVSTQ